MQKTPLLERIQRYVLCYNPQEYIPIHLDDMGKDGNGAQVDKIQKLYPDLPIIVKFWGARK